jgi:hypothetical protein
VLCVDIPSLSAWWSIACKCRASSCDATRLAAHIKVTNSAAVNPVRQTAAVRTLPERQTAAARVMPLTL